MVQYDLARIAKDLLAKHARMICWMLDPRAIGCSSQARKGKDATT